MRTIKTYYKDDNWDRFQHLHLKKEIELEFLHCAIMVEEDGNICAGAALYKNPHHIINGEYIMAIGYFYCDEKYNVYKLLMDTIIEKAEIERIIRLIGPIDGSTWNSYRFVSSSQSQPF